MNSLVRVACFVLSIASATVAAETPDAVKIPRSLRPVEPIPFPPAVTALFSPQVSLEDALIEAISAAKTEIIASQFVLTSPRVLTALVEAFHTKHVFIGIILDADPGVAGYTTPTFLRQQGLPVLLRPGGRGKNYQKFWIIDRSFVCTGSFDPVKGSEGNSADLLFIKEAAVVVAYFNNWCDQTARTVVFQP